MGKVALVTGAAGSGIGRSTALALARDGYDVSVNFRSDESAADEVARAAREFGVTSSTVQADLFDLAQAEALIPTVVEMFGRLDALVIGPGAGWHPEPPDQLAAEDALADTRQEVLPVFALMPHAISAIAAQGGGRIVGIATNQRLPSPSYAYNAAKQARTAALLGLVDPCWRQRITVNVVAPGPVNPIATLAEAASANRDFPRHLPSISPQDIAEIVAFLCSDKARFITGNVVGTYF